MDRSKLRGSGGLASGRPDPMLLAASIRKHRIFGKQVAYTTEGSERLARLLSGNNIDARAKAGIESCLKQWPLPAHRPVLEKRERLVDAVNLFNGLPVLQ